MKMNRTQRGRTRRLRRFLATQDEVILSVIVNWPVPSMWWRVGKADGSPGGHYFISQDVDGAWDAWQSGVQAKRDKEVEEANLFVNILLACAEEPAQANQDKEAGHEIDAGRN